MEEFEEEVFLEGGGLDLNPCAILVGGGSGKR